MAFSHSPSKAKTSKSKGTYLSPFGAIIVKSGRLLYKPFGRKVCRTGISRSNKSHGGKGRQAAVPTRTTVTPKAAARMPAKEGGQEAASHAPTTTAKRAGATKRTGRLRQAASGGEPRPPIAGREPQRTAPKSPAPGDKAGAAAATATGEAAFSPSRKPT